MNPSTVFRFIWVAGGLDVFLGLARDGALRETPLVPRDAASPLWRDGGFRAGGVYISTSAGALPRHIANHGSWLETDEWQGRAETSWLSVPARSVGVCVAGYPQHTGCELWAEFLSTDGTINRAECRIENPREDWALWSPPPDGVMPKHVARVVFRVPA